MDFCTRKLRHKVAWQRAKAITDNNSLQKEGHMETWALRCVSSWPYWYWAVLGVNCLLSHFFKLKRVGTSPSLCWSNSVCQDKFGNYTVQRIIEHSRGDDWQELRRRIEVGWVPALCVGNQLMIWRQHMTPHHFSSISPTKCYLQTSQDAKLDIWPFERPLRKIWRNQPLGSTSSRPTRRRWQLWVTHRDHEPGLDARSHRETSHR